MRVGGYPRVSTEEQAEEGYSIQEQIDSIQQWCKDNGHPPATIEMYVDDGQSAKDLKRPGIKRLIEDIKEKKYDIVVTTKLNRLSRKLRDILNLIDLMEKNNCGYVSIQEKFDTSTYIGRMQMQMLGVIAEFERERIAEDVRVTMRSIARKSGDTKKAFTPPHYGYSVVDNVYVINEEEAAMVREMVQSFLSGKGSYVIAKDLNSRGIKTRNGLKWHSETITHILNNESISGKLIYNRTYNKDGKRYFRPENEWIVIEDHHQPIIDEDTYNELLKALNGRRQSHKQADNERWLLSGIVKCAHCGATMKGITSKNRSRKDKSIVLKEYFRYTCSTYLTKGECFHHAIMRDDIEEFIINYTRDLAEPDGSKKVKIRVAETKSKDSERQAIIQKFNRLDARIQKQLEAYEDDLISAADLKKARERIDNERETLQSSLDQLDKQSEDGDQSKVKSNARRYLSDILSEDRATVKNGLRQVVQQIIVTNGESIDVVVY